MGDDASMLSGWGASDADSPASCHYCGRQFATARLLALHHGSAHTEEVSKREWESVVAAREAEATELRRFRIRMMLVLVAVYFGFLLLYASL